MGRQVYFAVHDFPEVPEEEQAPPPKHIVIYWDASGSRAASDHEREIGLLEAYLRSLAGPGPSRKRSIHVDLVLLRNAQAKPKHSVFPVTSPDRLIARLSPKIRPREPIDRKPRSSPPGTADPVPPRFSPAPTPTT